MFLHQRNHEKPFLKDWTKFFTLKLPVTGIIKNRWFLRQVACHSDNNHFCFVRLIERLQELSRLRVHFNYKQQMAQ